MGLSKERTICTDRTQSNRSGSKNTAIVIESIFSNTILFKESTFDGNQDEKQEKEQHQTEY